MTSPLTSTLRFCLLVSLSCLTACAGKPTPERCKSPQTTTTACTIPSPPIVEKKTLFDETLTVTPLTMKYQHPIMSTRSIDEKPIIKRQMTKPASKNIKHYTVQFGAFRQTQSETELRELNKKANGAMIYRYSLSTGLTGMSAGRFNSREDAESFATMIREHIAADAYIRLLPIEATLINP